ncbi:kelch repeat-containing protein [Pontibacter sp. SGAir0037]|uniref:Kelch repeat-containing protein n=1 Tax=Pontibacter sp. SGAir0037 TaxID=2571030 RepID=UPI0010CD465E|nr:kelch repeat-containing protein [Pontibacter sp. SGAir0037]QCR22694.1 galactose oxidase [Pontibacter sp. SGAir0037]
MKSNLILRNRSLYLLLLVLSVFVTTSCSDDEDDSTTIGYWTKDSDFAGVARKSAVSFTIGDKVYVTTGYDGKSRLTDLWEFDPAKSSWTRKADFPGKARSGAVGFAANGKGYVGTGYDASESFKDFWEYNPETNTWTQVADFPGTARYGAVALAIADKGYVGAGYDGNHLKDFWMFDPATGQWQEKVGLIGAKRLYAFAFTLNGKGYIGGGRNNGIYEADFLEYTPETDTWRKMKSLNSTDRDTDVESFPSPRASAATFEIGGRGYLVGGTTGSIMGDVWEYEPSTDIWTQRTSLSGTARESAVAFAIGNYGYVVTGAYSTYNFDDMWKYNPSLNSDGE